MELLSQWYVEDDGKKLPLILLSDIKNCFIEIHKQDSLKKVNSMIEKPYEFFTPKLRKRL